MAQGLNVKNLILLVDSQLAVQWLSKEIITSHPCHYLLAECKRPVVSPHWKVRIAHCYREANRAADWLANRGVNIEGVTLFIDTLPLNFAPFCMRIFQELLGHIWLGT